MSSYHIISEHSDFDFFPSCDLSLKGLASMISRLADSLEENEAVNVQTGQIEKEDMYLRKHVDIDNLNHVRDRSDSVDSGVGDCEVDAETGLEVISLEEVSYHCSREDGWMVVYDKVYEMTEYLERGSHPGGDDVMLEYLGYDATMAFRGVGHSRGAGRVLEKYLVGILPRSERLGLTADYT